MESTLNGSIPENEFKQIKGYISIIRHSLIRTVQARLSESESQFVSSGETEKHYSCDLS